MDENESESLLAAHDRIRELELLLPAPSPAWEFLVRTCSPGGRVYFIIDPVCSWCIGVPVFTRRIGTDRPAGTQTSSRSETERDASAICQGYTEAPGQPPVSWLGYASETRTHHLVEVCH